MRRWAVPAWLGLTVAGCVLATGCKETPRRCCCPARVPAAVTEPAVVSAKPPAADVVPPAPAAELTPPAILPATASDREPVPQAPGHAADYRWLVGRLHYVHVRDAWCLRYGPADDDRHGGRVTLVETGPMDGYRSGELVYVEGQLADPDAAEPSPPYRVQALRRLAE